VNGSGKPVNRIKIVYPCHDFVPSAATRTEQLVHMMSELLPHGIDTTLIVPSRAKAIQADERKAQIRRFYGLAAGSNFPAELREIPFRQGAGETTGQAIHDVRAVGLARSLPFDVLYTRDALAMVTAVMSGMPTIFETYRADINVLRRFDLFRRLTYFRPNLLGFVTHSRLARDSFLQLGVEPDRVHLGYNGFNPATVLPALSREAARQRIGLPATGTIVTYAGHVDAKKGTSILLEIAAHLPDVLFLIVGAEPGSVGEQAFISQRQSLGIDNVKVVARVPPADVPPYLYAADCLIIPPAAGPLQEHRRTVLPMKTFTYMATGRPILAADLPDVRELLTDDGNAVLVMPDRPREAADALRALMRAPERSARLAQQARADSAAFTWTARAAELAGFLRQRLEPTAAASLRRTPSQARTGP
jgi:glycosyltransferase involved in cell wall biosynthesis